MFVVAVVANVILLDAFRFLTLLFCEGGGEEAVGPITTFIFYSK